MIKTRQTLNAQRSTLNAQCRKDLNVGRWTLGVGRFFSRAVSGLVFSNANPCDIGRSALGVRRFLRHRTTGFPSVITKTFSSMP